VTLASKIQVIGAVFLSLDHPARAKAQKQIANASLSSPV
jgi:hypothetical protein